MDSEKLKLIENIEKLIDNNNREFLYNCANVTLKISPRESTAIAVHIPNMRVFDHYDLDFDNGTLTWKGCTDHVGDYVEGANYIIDATSDIAPPQGEMTLAEFSKYQRRPKTE